MRNGYTSKQNNGLVIFEDILSQLKRVSPLPHEGKLKGHEQGGFIFLANNAVPPPPVPSPPVQSTQIDNLIFVKGGTFQMGSNEGYDYEQPVHSVTLKDYYISPYEVTFEEYDAFCIDVGREKPDDEGWGRGKKPVINVNWYDAIEYCNWLSEKRGLRPVYTYKTSFLIPDSEANGYRLPTEAEWEYAARSRGGNEKWSGISDVTYLDKFCNSSGFWDDHPVTASVGSYLPNDIGIYDMSGNVYEWCFDNWHNNYEGAHDDGRAWILGGNEDKRVVRGGAWSISSFSCRVSDRFWYIDSNRDVILGFRIARY